MFTLQQQKNAADEALRYQEMNNDWKQKEKSQLPLIDLFIMWHQNTTHVMGSLPVHV